MMTTGRSLSRITVKGVFKPELRFFSKSVCLKAPFPLESCNCAQYWKTRVSGYSTHP